MLPQKIQYICEDFLIDLLNTRKFNETEEFTKTTHSSALYPKIAKPSKITIHCAAFELYIFFTNDDVEIKTDKLLINDISDHFHSLLQNNNKIRNS